MFSNNYVNFVLFNFDYFTRRVLLQQSLVYGKELMKNHQRELLLKKNEEECTRLAERFRSGDVQKQAQKLLAAKMKAKNSKL